MTIRQDESAEPSCPHCRARAAQPQGPRLHMIRPDGTEQTVVLGEKPVLIGTEDGCDLRASSDTYLSRRHARVRREGDFLFVDDLGSSNGTQLRIRRSIILEPGDELLVGTSIVRFEQDEHAGG